MPLCRESDRSPSKTKEGVYELTFIVEGTTDILEAEGLAYAKAPITYLGRFRKPGADASANGRGLFEFKFSYENDDEEENDEPQGDQPTIGTLQISGAGNTQHVSQCLSQVNYPQTRGSGLANAKVVGWHNGGVNGVDIKVGGSRYALTKKWLPGAIDGAYLDKLDDLQGKINQSEYTLRWKFRNQIYTLPCAAGELLFDGFSAKTDFTPAGVGVWEITYEMIRSKNKETINLGVDKDGGYVIAQNKRGHDYLWVVYESKEVTDPASKIEVPSIAFVSKMYEEADFQAKLGF